MSQVEPWLRGTLTDIDPVRRQVLHALEQAGEDLDRWCGPLSNEQMNARPYGLAPVAFHLRHIARSLDRLLTYAEGGALDASQFAQLRSELDPGGTSSDVMEEIKRGLESAAARVRKLDPETFSEARGVGRQALPTAVGSLLVHCAEHTQRHVGQAITTAKVVTQMAES